MRIFKIKILRVICFFIVFFILNRIVVFINSPAVTDMRKMLSDYKTADSISMIFCGASLVYSAFDPYKFDDLLNVNAFDIASPAQPIDITHSLLKKALNEHPVKTICIGCSYGTWQESPYFSRRMLWGKKEELQILSFYERIKTIILFLSNNKRFKDTDSIVFLFPWIYDRTELTPSAIIKNMREKLTHHFDYGAFSPLGKGYWRNVKINNYNNISTLLSKDLEGNVFSDACFEEFDKIRKLCKEKNIDLIVLAPPYTVYDMLAWGEEYFEKMRQIQSFFAGRGVEYYDFNFIKPEIFKSEENYFRDFQHMNSFGAEAFSTSFAKFMQLRAQGEDMEKYFYTPEEFLASIDYISAVNLSVSQKGNEILMDGIAYCGTPVTPEYQFLIKETDSETYTLIKDFGTDTQFSFKPQKSGKYTIRVNARKLGSDTEFDRYNERRIVFRKRGK